MKFLSPAKLNLNLNVVSKREDGFHNLSTTFQLINLFDEISFEGSSRYTSIKCDGIDINLEDNIIYKALNALRSFCKIDKAIEIKLKKIIPIGGGLGGGSSNAATTLIALNKIWDLNLSRSELMLIGADLGADVPVFVHGKNAEASGIGNIFVDVKFSKKKYLLICPNIPVTTSDMFQKLNINELNQEHQNSFLNILLNEFKSIKEFYESLINQYDLKLSGTGSTLFLEYENKEELKEILQKIPKNWRFFFCEGLQYSPLSIV